MENDVPVGGGMQMPISGAGCDGNGSWAGGDAVVGGNAMAGGGRQMRHGCCWKSSYSAYRDRPGGQAGAVGMASRSPGPLGRNQFAKVVVHVERYETQAEIKNSNDDVKEPGFTKYR